MSPASSGTMVVCQLLLLGAKAYCLSLREGQQETGSSNSRAAEEWLHDGPKGRPLTFWTTNDLDRQPP